VNALVYATIAALGNVVGALAVVRGARRSLSIIEKFVAFGAGFMITLALADVVPEAVARQGPSAAGWILTGYLLVHLTQHTATQHFHFGEEVHPVSRAEGLSGLIGLLLHTFFDGVAIASGFAVSRPLGLLFFLAILLHKLPEGVTVSSLQLAAGASPASSIASAALLGAATVVGVIAGARLPLLAQHGLPLAAGVTLYVGASNLVPEFQGKKGWSLPVAFFLGVGACLGARELLHVLLE